MALLLQALRDVRTLSGDLDLLPPLAATAGQSDGEVVRGLQHPGIARVGGEEHKRADVDDAPVLVGGTSLDRANLFGQVRARLIKSPGPVIAALKPEQ